MARLNAAYREQWDRVAVFQLAIFAIVIVAEIAVTLVRKKVL